MDAQCSCIWRTVNSSVKRTARRSFVSLSHTHTHTHTHSARAKKDTERERSFTTCRIDVLHVTIFFVVFPVKITEFLWNSSAFRTARSSGMGAELMRKRQSHWLALTYYHPCFDFSKSIRANAHNVINIHEPRSSLILCAFILLLVVEFVVVLLSYQFPPPFFYRNTKWQTIS